ncbi:MAG: c-type cytochrome [Flavobacteriales bacterium]|nr:c-type cytochrome [Flavobacteriales bacterium]MCX7767713.1 c-type cytochrome [Flavobacteriales bacterium]MDW8409392.1 c-type cytochrome [Flavobacteriales bacterium]
MLRELSSEDKNLQRLLKQLDQLQWLTVVLVFLLVIGVFFWMSGAPVLKLIARPQSAKEKGMGTRDEQKGKDLFWVAPDPATITDEEIKYGRELIVQTAKYLGPKGSVAQITNGMNCQNCHLEAGTKIFGNNYSAVASTYPKFRARSGTVESIEKRVNDCFERSLNGKPLAVDSREMKAIVAYIKWLGQNVSKGETPKGAGLVEVPFLDRPADPEKGRLVYEAKCKICHGPDGAGVKAADGVTYQYPPLWGPNSYNTGAGLYRLSRFAGYVKANMPLGATHDNPQLTDEEAWDVAAFVNSQPRPVMDISKDWPDISKKPIDHPFGPFLDSFPESQHKYGPFGPIKEFYQKLAEKKNM